MRKADDEPVREDSAQGEARQKPAGGASDSELLQFLEDNTLDVEWDGVCEPPWSIVRDYGSVETSGMIGEGWTLRDAIVAAMNFNEADRATKKRLARRRPRRVRYPILDSAVPNPEEPIYIEHICNLPDCKQCNP
jgi:hypothetical protein